MQDKRFKGKTYEELYQEDLKYIKKDLQYKNPFYFREKYSNNKSEWEIQGEPISRYIEGLCCLLNADYSDEIIKIIKEKQKRTAINDTSRFDTNFGTVYADSCYWDDNFIYFLKNNTTILQYKYNNDEKVWICGILYCEGYKDEDGNWIEEEEFYKEINKGDE